MAVEVRAAARPLSMAPFWMVWSGQSFSLLGSQLVQFALVWWLTRSSGGSAVVLAGATVMALLPQVFLGPLAGVLVDRWNRRVVMMVADGSVALTTVALAALFVAGKAEIWHVYAAMFVRALGGAFHWPAMQASTPLMVPERYLSRVAGLNQGLSGLANIIAPPLGAWLLERFSLQVVLGIDVATAVMAILPLCFIVIPQASAASERGVRSVWQDFGEGLRFVRRWTGLAILIGVIALLHFMAVPAFELVPILATRALNGDIARFAGLQMAFGVGLVAGGVTLGLWGGFKRRVVTAIVAVMGIGAGLLAVGLTPVMMPEMAFVALGGVGFMIPLINGSIQAVIQAAVPAELQGRVFTFVMSGSSAMVPLGMAVAGPLADAFGVRVWYWSAGLLMMGAGLMLLAIPQVMNLEGSRQ